MLWDYIYCTSSSPFITFTVRLVHDSCWVFLTCVFWTGLWNYFSQTFCFILFFTFTFETQCILMPPVKDLQMYALASLGYYHWYHCSAIIAVPALLLKTNASARTLFRSGTYLIVISLIVLFLLCYFLLGRPLHQESRRLRRFTRKPSYCLLYTSPSPRD